MRNKKVELRTLNLGIYTEEEIMTMANNETRKIEDCADYMLVSRYMTVEYCKFGNFEKEESFEDFVLRYVVKLLKDINTKETSVEIFEKYFQDEKATYKTLGVEYGVSTERIRQHIAYCCRKANKMVRNNVYKCSIQIENIIKEKEKDIEELFKIKFTHLSQKQKAFKGSKEWNENKRKMIQNWENEIRELTDIKRRVNKWLILMEIENIEQKLIKDF